jgi:hypothetical protein
MKRFWTVLLVVAVAVVMALPAGAKKPTNPDKPGPPAPLAISIGAQPMWVHEDDDLLRYTVTLENTTGTDISPVAVEFTAAGTSDERNVGTVTANDTVTEEFSRLVSEFPETETCEDDDECPLTAVAAVFIGSALITQAETSTPLIPIPACGFSNNYDENFASGPVLVSDICVWTLPNNEEVTKSGVWEITLWPTLPENTKKPFGAWADVRDGVPGNWCTMKIGTSSGFGDRWKAPYPVDLSVTGQVYLPGDENIAGLGLADGMCLGGGAGGGYFEVGNPDSFYLRTGGGQVEVQWVQDIP